MDRLKKFAGVTIESSSGIICHGVRLRPILRPSAERHDESKGPVLKSVDLNHRVPEQKLTSSKLVNRGRPVTKVQLEPLHSRAPPTQASVPGLNASRVSLPLLGKFQTSRPVRCPDESTSSIICQQMMYPRPPTKRDDKLKGPVLKYVDLINREPEQKLTSSKLVNRGRPVPKVQLEPFHSRAPPTQASVSGLNASRVSLPLLGKFQTSRPVRCPDESTSSIMMIPRPPMWVPPLKKIQPCRPLESRPHLLAVRRTFRSTNIGKDLGLNVTNTPGFPRLAT